MGLRFDDRFGFVIYLILYIFNATKLKSKKALVSFHREELYPSQAATFEQHP